MSLASTTIHLNGKFSYRVRQYGHSKDVHHVEVLDENEWEVVDITFFQGDFERFKEAMLKEPERISVPVPATEEEKLNEKPNK